MRVSRASKSLSALMRFYANANPEGPEVVATLYMYVLLGEPTTDIRTGALATLNVEHIATHAMGTFDVVVTVKESDGVTAVPDAVVCLYKEGDVHEAYVTDASGEVSFEVTADTAGEITVTVRKHAYVPYAGAITITE